MDGYRRRLLGLVLIGLATASGCQFSEMFRQYTTPPPLALLPVPTLEQVIQVVNRNNSQIHSYSTTQAKLSGPGFPTLRANVAFERPLRFRLRADTAMTGPELDLGSNDQYFWFWIRRNQPPAAFFCRHDQFAASRARQMMPIDPYWLIEALGTAEFDPGLPHQGPFPLSEDRLEVRTIRETPEGPTTKSTIIDAVQGYVLQQHVYDAQGRLLASSTADGHRRDPLSGLVMPTSVSVTCPAAQFSMRVDLGNVQINRLEGNPVELWTMPSYQGAVVIDLANPPGQPPAGAVSLRPGAGLQPWQQRRY